jgi:hypothetical protein
VARREQYLPAMMIGKITGQFDASDNIWEPLASHALDARYVVHVTFRTDSVVIREASPRRAL